jgi:pilus assembly protein FimV
MPEAYAATVTPSWDEQGTDLEFEATPVFDEAPESIDEQESVPVLDLSGIDLELAAEPVGADADFGFELPATKEAEIEVPAPDTTDEFVPDAVEAVATDTADEFAPDLVDAFEPVSEAEPADFVPEAPVASEFEPEPEPEPELKEAVSEAAPAAAPPADAVDPELWEEVNTKLDLARAYLEMGDQEGAREILHEVLGEGDPQQKADADKLLAEAG